MKISRAFPKEKQRNENLFAKVCLRVMRNLFDSKIETHKIYACIFKNSYLNNKNFNTNAHHRPNWTGFSVFFLKSLISLRKKGLGYFRKTSLKEKTLLEPISLMQVIGAIKTTHFNANILHGIIR